MASTVVVMNEGMVAQIGAPEQIYGDPDNLFVATFIGTPPINQLYGRLAGGAFHSASGTIGGFADGIEGDAILAVRPDHVSIADEDADLRGSVFAVEYTGSDLLVVADVNGVRVTLVGDLASRPMIDEPIGLKIDRSETLFFDPQTRRRIRAQS